MAVNKKEYMLSVDSLSKPKVLQGQEAIATLLIRLLLLNPGSNPLHPDMGVGLEKYRYCIGKIDELKSNIQTQMDTFLPEFSYSDVQLIEDGAQKICNIEITIDDTVYVYNSATMPIRLSLEEFVG